MTTLSPAPPLYALRDLDLTFLPVGQMRQITRVTALDRGSIAGEVELGSGHWVYPQHFPSDPIFPGSLMVEAAGQLVALWAWAHGHRGRPRLLRTVAEFRHPVGPADSRLDLRAEVRGKRHLQFGTTTIRVAATPVAVIETVLAVLPVDG